MAISLGDIKKKKLKVPTVEVNSSEKINIKKAPYLKTNNQTISLADIKSGKSKIEPIKESTKTHVQQYNLDGSKKIAPTVSITANNIANKGATNILNNTLQQDIKNKTFEAATGQNKQKIDLSGKSAQSTTPVTKEGLEIQRNQLMTEKGLQKKRDKLSDELFNYDREEKVKWWDDDLSFGKNLKNIGYKLIENQNTKYVEDEKYNELKRRFELADNELKNKKVQRKSANMDTLDKIGYTITGNVIDSTKGIESSVNKLFGQSTPVQSESFDEMMAQEARKQTSGIAGAGLDIVGSISKMLPQMIVSGPINSSAAAMTVGFANYGGSAYNEAKQMGATEEQATAYGITIGGLETGLEKLLGGFESVYGKSALGNVTNKIMGKVITNTAFRQVASGMAGEFTEEYLQEFLQPIVRNAILEEKNGADFWNAENLEEGVKQFVSQLFNSQNLYAGTLGAVSSGLMSGPSAISQNASINNEVKTIKEDINPKNIEEKISYLTNKGYDTNTSIEIVNKALKETGQPQIGVKNVVQNETTQGATSNPPQISQEIGQNQELSNETTNTSQTIETPKNNIKSYTENDINRLSTGNNLIDGVNSDLKSFTEKFYDKETKRAKKKKAPTKSQKMFLGRISDALSTKINSLLNNSGRFSQKYETKDTNIVISSDNIEHIYNHHGSEKMPGQIDVTPENLSKYVDVVSNPDYIGLSSQLSRGNTPTLYFTKKINGYSVAVEVLSTKKQLYPQSYYVFDSNSKEYTDFIKNNKLKKAWDVESGDFKSSDINVQDDTSAAFTDNNDTTKPKKSQVAPLSSQYSMQQNRKNDTKAPITRENNEINENIEKKEDILTPRQKKTREYREQAKKFVYDTINWKDKGLFNQKFNTMKRNLRDIAGVVTGDRIYEEYFAPISKHNATIERQITKYNDKIKTLKLTNNESTAVQMLGELKYNPQTTLRAKEVNDFIQKHKLNRSKIGKAVEIFRKTYDELFAKVNEVLKEQGYKEIDYRKGYFPHFNEEHGKTIIGKFAEKLGWTFRSGNLPTDIAGLTDEFKPGKKWTSFSQRRTGDITDYNALKGFDNYVRGAMQVIYHTEDIQKLRALENEIRYQHSDKGLQEKLDKILLDDSLYEEEREDQIEYALKDYNNQLGNFVTNLRDYTNNLAGKKSALDRSTEQLAGRKIYNTMDNITRRVSANMVGGNVASAFTNFIPLTQAWSQISTKNMLKSMGTSIMNSITKTDNIIDKSDYLTSRTKQADKLFKTGLQKVTDKAGIIFEAIDHFTSETIVRGKYYENLKKGMSETEAIKNADEFAKDVMAGRSQGDAPTVFNSKSPIVKLFSAFQLEVNNQYGYMFKDLPVAVKNEGIGKLIFAFLKMFLGAWLYNKLAESITGRKSAFSPIDIIGESVEIATNDRLDFFTKGTKITKNISEEIPFVGGLLGGGRIPISSAFPDTETTFRSASNLFKDDKRDKAIKDLSKELSKPLIYIVLPFGGGQLKKTYEGLSMFYNDKEIKGNYRTNGDLNYPVANTLPKKIQAGLFGKYASSEAREYYDNGGKDYLGKNQQKQYQALKIPISDYWEIKSNISKIKSQLKNSGKTEEERKKIFYEYIDSLDVSNIKKSILKKSIYKSYDEADGEIKEYINSSKMSKQSKKDLLKELGLDD